MTRDLTAITADLETAATTRAAIAGRELALALAAAGLTARIHSPAAHYIRFEDSDQTEGDIVYAALVDADGNDIDGADDDFDNDDAADALSDAMWELLNGASDTEVAPFTMTMQQGDTISKRPPYAGSDYLLVIDAMIAADPGPTGWTTFGIWIDDEPIPVATIAGKGQMIHGGREADRWQGPWATSNDDPDPEVAERNAIAEMKATLHDDEDDADADERPVGICKRCGVTLYRDPMGLMSIAGQTVCPGGDNQPGDWPHELDVHDARPDDLPEPGDRCKTCGADITWIGPSPTTDWIHTDNEEEQATS